MARLTTAAQCGAMSMGEREAPMLNPQPISLRMQRTVLLPLGLLLLALAAGSVAWLQSTRTASAADPYLRDYVGNATVKVKNGNAWQQYNMTVCLTVETNGPNGDITDVFMTGSDTSECSDTNEMFSSVVVGNSPGAFGVDTKEDTLLNLGKGWKPNPQKQTANQWLFTIQQPLAAGGAVHLNNDSRALTAGTTLTVKFIRERGGIYFKLAGFAPLNANGLPKVTVEIESAAGGLDAPPSVTNITPSENAIVDSDTVVIFTYDEPVTVDNSGPYAYILCVNVNDSQDFVDFNGSLGNLTITGQGTNAITLTPVGGLPDNAQYTCTAEIAAEGVDDVDTYDPPANWPASGGTTTFGTGVPG